MGENTDAGDRVRQELRQLLEAIAGRAQQHVHGGCEGASADGAPTSAGCGWCPVCVFVGFARGERSEATARLAEWLHEIVTGLRDVLAERETSTPEPSPPEPSPEKGSPRVSRIAVSRVRGSVIDDEDSPA